MITRLMNIMQKSNVRVMLTSSSEHIVIFDKQHVTTTQLVRVCFISKICKHLDSFQKSFF